MQYDAVAEQKPRTSTHFCSAVLTCDDGVNWSLLFKVYRLPYFSKVKRRSLELYIFFLRNKGFIY